MTARFDAVVVGAGAAGMMCAAVAGQRGLRVLLIDHYEKVGEKIRISGGGRCNFTNIHATHRDYVSSNPDFCRSALARYTPRDFIALVEKHGIAWHEKTLGQLFCDGSSQQIIEMLRAECAQGGVEWGQPCEVRGVAREASGFRLETSRGKVEAQSLVIATGGLTVPKIGATPFAYRIAEQFGLGVVPPKPALVPLTFAPEFLERYGDLAGVSLDAETTCAGGRFREAILFTHRGLSGPAILQISSYWQHAGGKEPIVIDLMPEEDVAAFLRSHRRGNALLHTVLSERLPKRFAERWCAAQGLDRAVSQLSDRAIDDVAHGLENWRVQPTGTQGYNKAEVTLGGVDTRGLSSKTMECLAVKGLFFIGEAVDVTGHLGGFNFQWAWASAHAAGTALCSNARMETQRGFTWIEMMAVIAVIGILALMAVPSMQEAAIRKQVKDGLQLAEVAKQGVQIAYTLKGEMPTDNAAAGLPAPEKIVGTLVKEVRVEQGAITVTFGNNANKNLVDKHVTVLPAVVPDEARVPIAWLCHNVAVPQGMQIRGNDKTDIKYDNLPVECRGPPPDK